MRILVTGACGLLGGDVTAQLLARGHEVIASGRRRDAVFPGAAYVPVDITDAAAVDRALSSARPDAVIHCAGWTAVDDAQDADKRDLVRRVNVDGAANVARACAHLGCTLMDISTDYVFSGSGETPVGPDSRDFGPLNVYGQSKLDGERAVKESGARFMIVRVQRLYGLSGRNFVRTMLRLGAQREEIRVVCDQYGTPTYTPDLARLLADMIETGRCGYYHAANSGGYVSWADFAREIMRRAGLGARIVPVTTAQYGAYKAARPLNGRLDTSKLAECGFAPLPDWRDALDRFLRELGKDERPGAQS